MGKLKRIRCKSREEWLSKRSMGIGASECSALIGQSPYMTANDLWNLKVGNTKPADLSDNEAVQLGVRLEKPLRELFKSLHPELKVSYKPFDMLYQEDYPFMYATLDGEFCEKGSNGRKRGILEIKTSTPNGKAGWDKWREQVPPNYYAQVTWQLLCTGYDYVILMAALFNNEGDIQIRQYRFDRADMIEDMGYMMKKAVEFWNSVQNQTLPPMTLVL